MECGDLLVLDAPHRLDLVDEVGRSLAFQLRFLVHLDREFATLP
jgi:hypothetical protein